MNAEDEEGNQVVPKPSERAHLCTVAMSLDELYELLPPLFAPKMKEMLLGVYRTTERKYGVQSALRKLSEARSSGSLPDAVKSIRTPDFPITAAFRETQPVELNTIAVLIDKAQQAVSEAAHSLKSREFEWYQNHLSLQVQVPLFAAEITKINAKIDVPSVPVWEDVLGELTITKWISGTTQLADYRHLLRDLGAFINRAITLAANVSIEKEQRALAKHAAKADADVHMEDVVDTRTAKQLAKEVFREEAAKLATSSKGKISYLRHSSPTHDFYRKGQAKARSFEEKDQQTVCQSDGYREGRAQASSTTWPLGKVSGETAREVIASISSSSWEFGKPESYPDAILDLPTHSRRSLLLSRVPVVVAEASRFRKGVHVHSDLFVPVEIQIHVSAGLKYMFKSAIKPTLPLLAYETYANTLRWKFHFFEKDAVDSTDYDPDYDLGIRSNRSAPRASALIERGLACGKAELQRQLAYGAPQLENDQYHGLIDVAAIESFCKDNNCVILHTDKNLGAAMVPREWVVRGTLALLEDQNNYVEIDEPQSRALLALTKASILEVSQAFPEGSQIRRFVTSNLSSGIDLDCIPKFYGIPKIHKSPWKMRPICPGYASMANPASKIVSKEIRVLTDSCRYVLRGSKDFVKKLTQVKVPHGSRAWIVCGDVVAYYPNIPRDVLRGIVIDKMKSVIHELSGGDIILEAGMLRAFSKLLDIALEGPVVTAFGRYFRQKHGLPMGWAASPDLANIYGAFFEEPVVPLIREILFYGRFIDDIFAIVLAPSKEAALTIARQISIQGVEIEWDTPRDNVDFLDLHLWLHDSGVVRHKPYTKKLSHQERIPWASYHPIDVKRGTFIGEMSRAATLCSHLDAYKQAIHDIASLYIGRGYPPNLVKRWISDNSAVRWATRLDDPVVAEPVQVLKSTFNRVWKSVQIRDVQAALFTEWSRVDEPLVGSRKRALSISSEVDSLTDERNVRRRTGSQNATGLHVIPQDASLSANQREMRDDFTAGAGDSSDSQIVTSGADDATKEFLADVMRKRLLVSRRRTANLWDATRVWNKAQFDAYMLEEASNTAHLDVWS
jgi:hypothetical protein